MRSRKRIALALFTLLLVLGLAPGSAFAAKDKKKSQDKTKKRAYIFFSSLLFSSSKLKKERGLVTQPTKMSLVPEVVF